MQVLGAPKGPPETSFVWSQSVSVDQNRRETRGHTQNAEQREDSSSARSSEAEVTGYRIGQSFSN